MQAGGQHWIACRPRFLLAVPVLSRLFRRLFLEKLTAAYQAGRLEFFADQAALAEPPVFRTRIAALRKVGVRAEPGEGVAEAGAGAGGERRFGEEEGLAGGMPGCRHRTIRRR